MVQDVSLHTSLLSDATAADERVPDFNVVLWILLLKYKDNIGRAAEEEEKKERFILSKIMTFSSHVHNN